MGRGWGRVSTLTPARPTRCPNQVNGSLARKAVKELISKNLIRPVLTHSSQTIYTRATNT
jgi:ribosomal protein S25